MYLISRSANLVLPIRDRSFEYHPQTGAVIKTIPAIVLKFQHSGTVPDYAKEAVSKMADWGQGIGLNEDPFDRCGCVDTDLEAVREGWSDEDKAYVEQVLRDGAGTLYVVADPPRAAKPWDAYDSVDGEDAAKQIVFTTELIGVSPSVVLAYELENKQRPDVIAALEELVPSEDEVGGVIHA